MLFSFKTSKGASKGFKILNLGDLQQNIKIIQYYKGYFFTYLWINSHTLRLEPYLTMYFDFENLRLRKTIIVSVKWLAGFLDPRYQSLCKKCESKVI